MTVRFVEMESGKSLQDFLVKTTVEYARVGARGVVFHLEGETLMVTFDDLALARKFTAMLAQVRSGKTVSVFNQRTEESSATQYFQFYGYLSQQQNMMQDFVRTSTYQKAILSNLTDFRDKIVLDVGAGSGILSFFAQQAGAKRVYAVEGSSIAKYAERLVKSNKVDSCIKVISGKIEEIDLPEKVDMIISEPMGYMLLNERMLETYLHAKKWLKPNGKMFPSRGDLHVAPFTDEALYMEQINKVNFWYQDFFHGVNLSSLRDAAMEEYFRQPIVDTFDIRICLAKTHRHVIDFGTADESELHRLEIPLEFHMLQTGTVHGLAFWFDVAFIGTGATVWLSTAPTEPLTHWYQVRCLLKQPVFAKVGICQIFPSNQ
jgi:histone-arginine methyltransferase CARM1